ncbi:zinc protease [Defluviimonas sp. 20V17]|uniref:Peptidase M16 n=1 Tax=Allgaiera indica TaxID=765699 RepID=A0AAN4UQX4_9RHOB|nr:pitrilysin family protein [Allgaiera indica]KDB02614.1 zinc protease [Defluviimonas sp. 20V17]GHE01674.1 peptidase M16 [Allgaiera indica]SDW96567.1 zinc protease [Allgaiera indica]
MIRQILVTLCAGFLAAFTALPAKAEVNIAKVTSPGGITAWLVEAHDIPFTALEIRFRGGTSLDAPGKRGAVNLMAGLLEEGAGTRDAQAFAAARDGLAAEFGFGADPDSVSVSARFLTKNRDQAVALLHQALTAPRFDDQAIARVKAQVMSSLRAEAKDPEAIASATLFAQAFGAHPYGSKGDGTVDSVPALTREDLVAAWHASMARDRLFVAAVGDITPEALGRMLDTLFAGLPARGAPMPPRATDQLTGGVTIIPFDTPQSAIQFGAPGLDRHDPDFFAAYVLNEIFGGRRFTARLMQEVRVKRGLTYGVGTYLMPMDHGALILGALASDNAKAAEAVAVIRAGWDRLAQDGVTQAELDAAKTYLTGAYPLRFDGNARIAQILAGMQLDEMPISYIATRNAKIEALTLADLDRVAKRLYRPDALRFVVVGRPRGLQATDSARAGN